jgi:hypothetical protein
MASSPSLVLFGFGAPLTMALSIDVVFEVVDNKRSAVPMLCLIGGGSIIFRNPIVRVNNNRGGF